MKVHRIFVIMICFLAFRAFADIYSWTDRNGVKHFSNDPPPKEEGITDVIRMTESREEPQEDTTKSAVSTNTNKKAEIYVDPSAEACIKAMAFFDQNKIPYVKHDITASDDERKRFENLKGTGVPLIFIGENRVEGWNEAEVRRLLDMNK